MEGSRDRIEPPRRRPVDASIRILRFDRVQRAVHWANALLFGILMVTALPLYFPSMERVVGRHVLIAEIHLWAGVALPVPILVALIGPWGAGLRRDLRRINRWTEAEWRWLWTRGRDGNLLFDKFNPGQKLNAIFVGAAIVIMLGTGAMLKWFNLFPVSWRTGATFVHEVLAFVIFVVVFGHIAMALSHPDSLRSMLRGWVTEKWAKQNAPRWFQEDFEAADSSKAGVDAPSGASGGAGH
jgi:formate dehydrogenase subunit gamma